MVGVLAMSKILCHLSAWPSQMSTTACIAMLMHDRSANRGLFVTTVPPVVTPCW